MMTCINVAEFVLNASFEKCNFYPNNIALMFANFFYALFRVDVMHPGGHQEFINEYCL